MMLRRALRRIIPILLLLSTVPVLGEGPLFVGGDLSVPGQLRNVVPGKPFRWNINPLTYWIDLGPASGPVLGNQTKAQADQIVADAFQVWQDVPSATITFSKAGNLSADVTSTNVMAVLNDLSDCTNPIGPIAQPRTIIYDLNGSITQALTGDNTTTLGFASPVCFSADGVNNSFERGYAVLNGIFIDGVNTPSNPEVSLTEFKAAFIHEFGHLIGLDHSQINVDCLYPFNCGYKLAGLPTMFPILVDGVAMSTLAPDDIAGISELYPDATFASSTGRIRGRLYFSDGVTQAQAFNIIARQVDDPNTPENESRDNAVSNVSGFLFTGDEGNPLVQFPGFTPSRFGSHDQTLIGYYEIPGLAPGMYTVEVEAFDPGFTGGSGIGPVGSLGLVFPNPSSCIPSGPAVPIEFLNTAPPESSSDGCTESNPLDLTTPGTILDANTDIILNGTPPRYDAYEDGP